LNVKVTRVFFTNSKHLSGSHRL